MVGEFPRWCLNTGWGTRVHVVRFPSRFVYFSRVVRAGAGDEDAGKSGLAHLLEHMMFRGCKLWKSDRYTSLVARDGTYFNALTDYDHTIYEAVVLKEKLSRLLRLEVERSAFPSFSEFETEKDVVMQEAILYTSSVPDEIFDYKIHNKLFPSHPYRFAVIGEPKEIENLSLEDVRRFHEKFYKPPNAEYIVVGDVDPEKVARRVEELERELFSAPSAPPSRNSAGAEVPEGERLIFRHPAIKQRKMKIYFAIRGRVSTEELIKLSLFSLSLTGGKSSRLYRRLVVDSALCAGVRSSAVPTRDFLWFEVSALLRDGTPEEVETTVRKTVKELNEEGLSEEESEKISTLVKFTKLAERETLYSVYYSTERGVKLGDPDYSLRILRAAETLRKGSLSGSFPFPYTPSLTAVSEVES